MGPPLSEDTSRRLKALFPGEEAAEAERLLVRECGNDLPFCERSSSRGLERIRFAVLKLSDGSLERLRSAIDLARTDWRDVLVAAGFANDPCAHFGWHPAPRPAASGRGSSKP
jgi:hypothetical protein